MSHSIQAKRRDMPSACFVCHHRCATHAQHAKGMSLRHGANRYWQTPMLLSLLYELLYTNKKRTAQALGKMHFLFDYRIHIISPEMVIIYQC